jgi:predicted DNA-binding WGR domain protein
MSAVVLHRNDITKRMHRYYRMDVQLDLFGAWCLMREWGRIGRAGQVRSVAYATAHEAEAALQRQYRAKQRRGYLTD